MMDYAASPFDIKSLDDAGHIEGLLAGFGNVDSYGDRIASTAFRTSLAARGSRPLPMLLHHDTHRPIGAWRAWEARNEGLYVKGKITLAVRDGQEAYALAKDGVLTGLSIGYVEKAARYDAATGVNDLLELDLKEGSLVTFPANPKTEISVVKAVTSARDIAELLQEAGLSGRKAKAAAGAAWKAINDQPDDAAAEAEVRAILNASAARIAAIGGK